jgi:hypothetical protein
MIPALLLLAGCPNMGGVKPESVNQSFYLAYALVESAYDSVELAILGGYIQTQVDARNIKRPIDETKASLDIAKVAYDNGRPFDEGVFTTTRQTLLLLQKSLIALGAEDNRPQLQPQGATP